MGHTRLKAAQKLGLTTAPVHQALELSPNQVKALRLMDNKSNEYAEWIDELLIQEIGELGKVDFDLILTGFKQNEIDEILNSFNQTENKNDADAVPEVGESICKPGDLWQLGNHKLLCGDSTKEEDVKRLMDGEKADMVFTDPPYNVDYGINKNPRHKIRTIKNDKMTEQEWDVFVSSYLNSLFLSCDGNFYITMSDKELGHLQFKFIEAGGKWGSFIIWVKDSMVLSTKDYHSKHEIILYGWKNKVPGRLRVEDRTQTDVWEIPRPKRSDMHPTMKPIELIEKAISNSSKSRMSVLDLFLGSGSTLIACEKTNRRCYGMEIDEHYCSVILQRWSDYTNKEPIREDGKKWSELKND